MLHGSGGALGAIAAYLATATLPAGAITTSQPMTLTQEWNAGAVTFTGFKVNITDTASAAGSLFADFQVATVSKFSVGKDGTLLQLGNATIGSGGLAVNGLTGDVNVYSLGALGFSNSVAAPSATMDVKLYRDAAAILALRNGVTAQTFRAYNTWTDASNGEWFEAVWSGNLLTLKTNKNGTGAARDLAVVGVATPAGGSTAARLIFGTTAGFGIYYGSGAPTVSAAQGSLYLRSEGSSTSTRAYINTNGATTWTAITTVA